MKTEEKTEEQKAKEKSIKSFVRSYERLVKKHNLAIGVDLNSPLNNIGLKIFDYIPSNEE